MRWVKSNQNVIIKDNFWRKRLNWKPQYTVLHNVICHELRPQTTLNSWSCGQLSALSFGKCIAVSIWQSVHQHVECQILLLWSEFWYCSQCTTNVCLAVSTFLCLLSPSYSINLKVHNQKTKVPMNFLDQEKCSSKCQTDILAQKLPLKIIGEGWQHEPNLPAVCLWKSSVW